MYRYKKNLIRTFHYRHPHLSLDERFDFAGDELMLRIAELEHQLLVPLRVQVVLVGCRQAHQLSLDFKRGRFLSV